MLAIQGLKEATIALRFLKLRRFRRFQRLLLFRLVFKLRKVGTTMARNSVFPGAGMHYDRRILLIALGTTPHLLTVTLAALFKKDPAAMPTEIHVLTTSRGAAALTDFLPTLERFYKDYGLAAVGIPDDAVHVMTGGGGAELDDIRTPADSSGAADFTVSLVRKLTADGNASLAVSIVGGRKSMSLLLGTALSFFGRDQDMVSHVISPEDCNPYPSPEALKASPETVNLGEIPFLRLRPVLHKALLSQQYSYSEIVAASQASLSERPTVALRCVKGRWRLHVNNVEVRPERRQLGLYVWLALRQSLERTTNVSIGGIGLEPFFFLRVQFLMVLKVVSGEKGWHDAAKAYIGLSAERLEELLKRALGEDLADERALYRWLQRELAQEERRSVNEAARKFSLKLSSVRTKFNDTLKERLSEAIPDVTQRRIDRCQIQSSGDKESVSYWLEAASSDIELPADITDIVGGATSHPAYFWKRI